MRLAFMDDYDAVSEKAMVTIAKKKIVHIWCVGRSSGHGAYF